MKLFLLLIILIITVLSHDITIHHPISCEELSKLISYHHEDPHVTVAFNGTSASVTGDGTVVLPYDNIIEFFGVERMNEVNCKFQFNVTYLVIQQVKVTGFEYVDIDVADRTTSTVSFTDCDIETEIVVREIDLNLRVSDVQKVTVHTEKIDDMRAISCNIGELTFYLDDASELDSLVRLQKNNIDLLTVEYGNDNIQDVVFIVDKNTIQHAVFNLRDNAELRLVENVIEESQFTFTVTEYISTITNNSFSKRISIATDDCFCVDFSSNHFGPLYELVRGCVELNSTCTDPTCDTLTEPIYQHKDLNCDLSYIWVYAALIGTLIILMAIIVLLIVLIRKKRKDANPYRHW